MKVLHNITGLNVGGAETVLYRLCTATQAQTEHIVVSLTNAGKYGPLLEEKGIKVHTLHCKRGVSGFWAILKLMRIIRLYKPDIVQTWMYHANFIGGIAAWLVGSKKIVWGIRHTDLEQNRKTTQWISSLCAMLSHKIPSSIVCCSDRSAQVHREYGYAADKLSVIYNGYDLEAIGPSIEARGKIRAELSISENQLVFGMVGRWNAQKDHANLLQALSILKQSQVSFLCLLVGPQITKENNELMELIKKANLQDQIYLLGKRTDVPAIMNALDVHVLSSLGEAFPNVVAEAMACDTPCVTTDVGDAGLIVGNPDWVVPPKSPKLLAKAILNAVAFIQEEGRDAVALSCRQRIVDNFSLERMIGVYYSLWNSAAEKQG